MELYLRSDKRGPWFEPVGYLDQPAKDLLNEILYRQGFRKLGKYKTGPHADLGDTLRELMLIGFGLQVTPEVLRWYEDRLNSQDQSQRDLEIVRGMIEEQMRREYPDWEFWPHQLEAAEKLAEEKTWILGDDPGLGKTLSNLLAIPLGSAVLVLCPLNAKNTWRRHARQCRPDLRVVTLAAGDFRWPEPGEMLICHWAALPFRAGESEYLRACETVAKRHKKLIGARWSQYLTGKKACEVCGELGGDMLRNDQDISIRVHREHVPEWIKEFPKAHEEEFPRTLESFCNKPPKHIVYLVLDEAQEVLNPKSSRTKRWNTLSKTVEKGGGYCWGSSATPIENREREIYNLLKAFRLEVRCFPEGADTYMRMAGGALEDQWHGRNKRIKTWVFKLDKDAAAAARDPELPDRLAQGILRRTAQEVYPDMPAVIRERRTVEGLTEGLSEELAEMFHELYTEDPDLFLESLGQNKRFLELKPKLALLKVPAALEVIREHFESCNDPLLFCSVYRDPVLQICQAFGAPAVMGGVSDAERDRIQEEFQAGRIPLLGFTIGAGALSSTYSRAWKLLKIDEDLSYGKNVQAEGRLRAHLQDRTCQITTLVLDCPLEEHTAKLLERKASLVNTIVNPIARSRNRGRSLREQLQQNLESLWAWQLICGFQNMARGKGSASPLLVDLIGAELRRPHVDAYRGSELSRLYRKLLGGLSLTPAEMEFAQQNCSIQA